MASIISQSEQKVIEEQVAPSQNPIRELLHHKNFRWLWIGEFVSLLGDQFYLIALPWLVLQLTGDAFLMGSVLAVEGIPRALFMLVGGAFTDRYTPRNVMLWSNIVRMLLVLLLAVLIFMNSVEIWMIFVMVLVFGIADAFFFPAQSAIVPRLIQKDRLEPANALIQGTMQISLFAGPVLAGILIALLGSTTVVETGETIADIQGIGFALVIDALTFLISVWTLLKIKVASNQVMADENRESVFEAIKVGLKYVWKDQALRTFFFMISIANFLIIGPMVVGIPVLADTRYAEGAAAFGILMSTYGGGSLLGIILAGTLPKPPAQRMGIILGVVWSFLGIGVALLGIMPTTLMAAIVTTVMGISNGYVVILFVTWLQRRTPEKMLGRMMSLLMFASQGLVPVSHAVSGGLLALDTVTVFVVSGSLMVILVFIMILLNPAIREMEDQSVSAENFVGVNV